VGGEVLEQQTAKVKVIKLPRAGTSKLIAVSLHQFCSSAFYNQRVNDYVTNRDGQEPRAILA